MTSSRHRQSLAILALLCACGDPPTLQVADAADAAAEDAVVVADAGEDAGEDAQIWPPALTISPSLHDFDVVKLGNTSTPRTFTVTNVGGSTAVGLTLIPHGSNQTDFVVTSNDCTTLPAAAWCTFSVSAQPTHVGAVVASFQMSALSGSVFASVRANSLSDPWPLVVTPSGRDYGPIGLAQTVGTTFTVTSYSGVTETPTVSIGGANPAAFALAQDTCTGVALAMSATCTVQVRFHDTSIGARTAVLRVAKSNGWYSEVQLRGAIVSGDGLLFASTSSIAFGNQPVGTTNGVAGFTVTNNSAMTTVPLNLAVSGDAVEFPLTSDCSGAALATGDSCHVEVRFAPVSVGSRQATVAIVGQSPTAVALTGSGSFFTLSPILSGDFGVTEIGQTRSRSFTITNVGTSAFSSLSVASSGTNVSQFSLLTDTCSGATVAPNASCTLTIKFTPTTTGTKSASYAVSAPGAGSIDVDVTGNGILP